MRGAYVTGLTDDDISQLDRFEGVGELYNRKKVRVKLLRKDVGVRDDIADSGLESLENGEVETETYVWAESGMELDDQEWDFEHFRREKMRGWMGQPGILSHYDGEVDAGFAAADAARAERERAGSAGRGRVTSASHSANGARGTSAGRNGDARSVSGSQGRNPIRSTSTGSGSGAVAGRSASEARGRGAGSGATAGRAIVGRGVSSHGNPDEGQSAGRGRAVSAGRGARQAQLPARSRGASDDRGVSKVRDISGGRGARSGRDGREIRGTRSSQDGSGSRGSNESGGASDGQDVTSRIFKELKAIETDLENMRRRDEKVEKTDHVKAIRADVDKIRKSDEDRG